MLYYTDKETQFVCVNMRERDDDEEGRSRNIGSEREAQKGHCTKHEPIGRWRNYFTRFCTKDFVVATRKVWFHNDLFFSQKRKRWSGLWLKIGVKWTKMSDRHRLDNEQPTKTTTTRTTIYAVKCRAYQCCYLCCRHSDKILANLYYLLRSYNNMKHRSIFVINFVFFNRVNLFKNR